MLINQPVLADYVNGGYRVTIYEDGTKVRIPLLENPVPVFPESIDLKITNKCDLNCPFCHEASVEDGAHANFAVMAAIAECLKPGMEVAIGGGNPLAHPDLVKFLKLLQNKGVLPNITINYKHLQTYKEMIQQLVDQKLVYGVGVSNVCAKNRIEVSRHVNENVVLHTIAGIDKIGTWLTILNNDRNNKFKLLVLGYKEFGRGKNYFSEAVSQELSNWKFYLPTLLALQNVSVSFDNLAVEQLDIRRLLSVGQFNEVYMGNDGEFTMYIDAVRSEFAISSTSSRFVVEEWDIVELFRLVRRKTNG